MAFKRVISVALLGVFLFNIVGYYGVYEVLKASADSGLRSRLDTNNFDESETITFKVPLSIPYQSNSDFSRVDGDFEKDGKFYNLVKQKIENDTLIIVAVHDHEEATLFESLVDFVQLNTDNPISQKAGKLIESFAKDFICSYSSITTVSRGWVQDCSYVTETVALTTVSLKIQTPPPQA